MMMMMMMRMRMMMLDDDDDDDDDDDLVGSRFRGDRSILGWMSIRAHSFMGNASFSPPVQLTKVIKGYGALIVFAREGVRTWEQVLQKLATNPFERASHAKDVSHNPWLRCL